jgi:N-acetylglucosamine-6-phosphate deacetylase
VRGLGEAILVRGGSVISSGRFIVRDIIMDRQRFVRSSSTISHIIDAAGLFVTPGLIDIQINGFGGKEFIEGDEVVAQAQQSLPQFGVTSFLPTVCSEPTEHYKASLFRQVIDAAKHRVGADVVGWHLEGPFLNPLQAGIHRPEHLLSHIDRSLWEDVFSTGSIRLMTLAPELEGVMALIDCARHFGVSIAVGHSQAEEHDLQQAVARGATFVSHLFNAMPPFHHRFPGLVGAVLGRNLLGCTLIADICHVAPEALQIAYKCCSGSLALVSDGAPLVGSSCQRGSFMGRPVEIAGEKVVTVPGGAIAGSLIPLNEQLRRFIVATHCSFACAIRAASEVPAKFVQCAERKGKIADGFDADCVLWHCHDDVVRVVATFCRGILMYCVDEFWERVRPHA